VQVCAEHGALQAAFGFIASVVAEAESCFAERPCFGSEEGAAAVVFETDKRFGRERFDFRVDDHVADEALFPRLRADVDHADAWESFAVGGLVVVAEQLVAATYSEDGGAAVHRSFQRRLLELEQVLVDERLLAVLAAAEEEDVDLLHLRARAAPELDQLRLVSAPLGALEQREDVAAVAIDVHQVGIKPADREGVVGSRHLSMFPSKAWPNRASRARLSGRASPCTCTGGGPCRLRWSS
jgi:hypothetical protein